MRRAALLVSVVLTGLALHRSRGHYDSTALVLMVASWLTLTLAFASGALDRVARVPLRNWLMLAILCFIYKLMRNPMIGHATEIDYYRAARVMNWVAALGALPAAALIFLKARRPGARVALWAGLGLCAVSLVVTRVLTVISSPSPHIDVFTFAQEAANYLQNGLHPYTQPYKDIYAGAYDYAPGYTYWPTTILVQFPFHLIFNEVRGAQLVADVGFAGLLFVIATRAGRERLEAALIGLLWLAFPASLFVLEQAWVDTFLLTFGAGFLLLAMGRRWIWAGVVLGAFCAIKQYTIFFALLALVLALRDREPMRAAWRMVAATTVTFFAITLPFALTGWDFFLERTVLMPLRIAMRPDALTLVAWAKLQGFELPGAISGVIYLLATALAVWRVARAPGDLARGHFALSCAWLYGIVFLLGKQAFCNYYALFAGLTCLALAALTERYGKEPV